MITLPGRHVVRWRVWVIAAWAALAALFAPKASRVQQVLSVRGGAVERSESARASQLLREAFPNPIADYVAIVVHGPVRYTNPRFVTVVDSISAALSRQSYISQVVSARTIGESTFVSKDRRTTFIIAALTAPTITDLSRTVVPELREVVNGTIKRLPRADGFDVKVTGNPALDYDVRVVSTADTRNAERRAVPLTLVVLVLAFGALVAATLPIMIGILAMTIALGIIAVVAQFQTMSIFVLNITTMVGLGVGIDYSLLIVTRFREELNRGLGPLDAATRTVQTAGSAVVTSGLTVFVGFAALTLTPLTETRSVGVGGLIVVAVAVFLSTTFLPAMLAILGRNIDRPKWLARMLAWIHTPTGWERWARSLGHHPWRAILGGGLVAAFLTFPLTQMKVGLPVRNWFPPETESGQALEALREMGASGVIQPLRVVVLFAAGESALSGRRLSGLKALSDSIEKDPRVREVRGVATVKPGLSTLQLAMFYSDADSVRERYPAFFNAYLSADRRTTLIDVIATDTVSLTGMMDLTRHVRQTIGSSQRLRGAEIVVGGFAASSLDLQEHLMRRFPGMVGLILGVTGIMLLVAFRSILVPLKAVVLNCVSVGAAFGITVLVFQHGYGVQLFGLDGPTEAIFVIVPVLVFATVFGLSMDYEVFLLTRIKEVFDKTGRNDHATMEGLSATASTITFAALIMIIVFGNFAFARVLAVQFIGFGLAVAVFLDATLIRMVLVPAIMHIAGRWNWWPGVRAPRRELGAEEPTQVRLP